MRCGVRAHPRGRVNGGRPRNEVPQDREQEGQRDIQGAPVQERLEKQKIDGQ